MSDDTDDELLLRNVNDLKKRLLQTERSLQLLQSPDSKSAASSRDSRTRGKSSGNATLSRYHTSVADLDSDNEPLQLLSLDDLTLDTSDASTGHDRSHGSARGYQSYHKHSYTATTSRNFKSDSNRDSLSRELQAIQDEKAKLKSDNRRLQNKLESSEYQLKAAMKQINSLSVELETSHGSPLVLREKLVNLESEVVAQDETLRDAEDRLEECLEKLAEKESQSKKLKDESRNCKADLMHEIQCRKRMETQRDKALRNLEDLNDHLTEFRTKTKEKLKRLQDSEDHLKNSLSHCTKEREELIDKTTVLEAELQDARDHVKRLEELSYTNSTLQATTHSLQSSLKKHQQDVSRLQDDIRTRTQENQDLQSSVTSQQQHIVQIELELESKTREAEDLREIMSSQTQQNERLRDELDSKLRENRELSELTEIQNERLAECQRDMEANQQELRRLEDLAQKLQRKVKSYTSDSPPVGVGAPLHSSSPHSSPNLARMSDSVSRNNESWNEDIQHPSDSDYATGSSGGSSSRAVIAELRMKLAIKEAEVHKLEAARQKDSAGYADNGVLNTAIQQDTVGYAESSVLSGLRSELTSIVQKNKIGDRKAQELEGIINRLEEERNKQTYQLMEMQQQMADEESHSAKLQARVEHCSVQIRDLQREISEKTRTVEDIEIQVRRHEESHSANLQARVELCSAYIRDLQREISNKTRTVEDIEIKLEERTNQISVLEEQLDEKSASIKELVANLTSVKGELQEKGDRLSQLENDLKNKTDNLEQVTESLSQVKSVHTQQCQELQHQLELLQDDNEVKGTKLRQSDKITKEIQDELDVRLQQVKDMEKALQDTQQELDVQASTHAKQWQSVQKKTEDGSNRVAHLEAALMVCKEELTVYIEQLEEAKDRHDYEMDGKHKEVVRLNRELQQVHGDLKEKQGEMIELEQTLHQRQQMLQQSMGRMADLEDGESHLTEQVSHLERELSQVRSSSEQDAITMEKKLHQACLDLEDRTAKLTEAAKKMSDYKSKLKEVTNHSSDVERQLSKARSDADKQAAKIAQLDLQFMHAKGQMQNSVEKVKQTEDALAKTKDELDTAKCQISDQDVELTRAQEDLRAAASQLTELQRLLQRSRTESMERHKRVQELTQNLKHAKEELHNHEQAMSEMENALRASHDEIENRTAQVSQLDSAIKDRQVRMEKQMHQLEDNLSQSQYELKQCSKQMGDLDDKCQHQKTLLKEKTMEIQQLEEIKHRQTNQMRQREKDIAELEQKLAELQQQVSDHKSEELEQAQHVRLTREQTQIQHAELIETRHQVTQLEIEKDQISRELEEAMELVHKKDTEKAHLAEQIGQLRAQGADIKAQLHSELQHIKQSQEKEQSRKNHEITQLQKSQAELLTSINQSEASNRLALKRLRESESHLQHEVEDMREKMTDMEHELLARREVVEAANEAIVIKEAEVARLHARISGYERAAFGVNLTPSNMSKDPSHIAADGSSPAFSSFMYSPDASPRSLLRRSISDAHLSRKDATTARDYYDFHIDRDHAQFDRESTGHRESFNRIFSEPFNLDAQLFPNMEDIHPNMGDIQPNMGNTHLNASNSHPNMGNPHPTSTGYLNHSIPPPNTNSHHSGHHGMAGDLAQTNPPSYNSPLVQRNSKRTGQDSISAMKSQSTTEHSYGNTNHQAPPHQTHHHVEDLESLDGENLNSLQNMLVFVNRQIAKEDQLKHGRHLDPASSSLPDSPSFVPLPDTPSVTPQKSSSSSSPGKTQPRRKGTSKTPSPSSKRTLRASPGGRSKTQTMMSSSGVKPRIVRSSPNKNAPHAGDNSGSPQTTPLKQKLAKQRTKMAVAQKKLKPLDCMTDLHNKLRANDERRKQVDQQLFGL